jgi:hypothetical protein
VIVGVERVNRFMLDFTAGLYDSAQSASTCSLVVDTSANRINHNCEPYCCGCARQCRVLGSPSGDIRYSRRVSVSGFSSSLLAQILNGPGFFFPWPFGPIDADWIRLPGVALFWAWLGRGLDRRLRGEQTKMKNRRSRRLAWNLVMLGVAALFAFEFLRQLHMQTLLPFDNAFHGLMWSTPWNVKC